MNKMLSNKLLYVFLLAVVGFDPQNKLELRPILLLLCSIIWLFNIKEVFNIRKIDDLTVVLFVYLMPIYGVIIYIFRSDGINILTDTSYISTALVASLVYVLRGNKQLKIFENAIIKIGLIYIFLYILICIEILLWGEGSIINYLIENDIARIGLRSYAGIDFPYIYLYTSTLLILPLVITYNRINAYKLSGFVYFYGITFCLILSGTRSHILIGTVFSFLMIRRLSTKLFIVLVTISVLILGDIIYGVLKSMLDANEGDNHYKISMIDHYSIIFSNVNTIIFGQGFEAIGWDNNLKQMVNSEIGATKTELTFLELFRVFGIGVSLIIICGLLFRVFQKSSISNVAKKQALLVLLIDSALNPHLFSTYGAIIFAYAFSNS